MPRDLYADMALAVKDQQELFHSMFGGIKSLTKKDFEALARAIAKMHEPIRVALAQENGANTEEIIEIIAAQIGMVLGGDNAQFDSFRFVERIKKLTP